MLSWVIIVVLLIIGVFLIKMNHLRHRFFILFLLLIALFLYATMTLVNNQHSLDFSNAEGIFDAGKVYLGWLANGFSNLRTITGNAVKMDWSSSNKTLFSEKEKNTKKTSNKK